MKSKTDHNQKRRKQVIKWLQAANENDLKKWDSIDRNSLKPFVHRMEAPCNRYLYDANTCEILRVDNVLWDIIEDHGSQSKEAIIQKHCQKRIRRLMRQMSLEAVYDVISIETNVLDKKNIMGG